MLTVTTPPAAEPVSVAELKSRLRVTHSAEDDLIAALIPAARGRVEAELGLALAPTGFRETFDPCVERVVLSRAPRSAVAAVAVDDGAGGWTTLAASAWRMSAQDRPTRVQVLGVVPRAVRVDYTAGFPDCPAPLKEAVLALAVEAYERRGDPAPTLAAAAPWLAAYRRGAAVSAGGSLAEERPATLEAATEVETPYGGRTQAWATVASLWVALKLAPVRDGAAGEDHPPAAAQAATATARDHPFAAAGQRLVLAGEPPFRVRELRRGEPEPGRMTLILDRLL